ncbi:MAG: response regulator transcription factor [Anaerolineae bacterium]|nr:response regulator transcription factor [Anaerolineae bacterium]
MDEIRVLIIANDPLARAGVTTLLADQTDCVVVGQIAGDSEALDELDVYQPDVILWDLGWTPEEALDQLAELPEAGLPIVALVPDETHAGDAWAAGLRGLLLRNFAAEKLAAALRAATEKLVTIDPALIDGLFPAALAEPAQPLEALTPRELEVLQLLAEGLPNKTIARRLGISDHTVKFHVNAILGKLEAQSRTEAVVRATRLGLIML